MTDATELDEAAIRARVEAATEGPWFVEPCGDFGAKTALIPAVLRERYGVNGLNCGEDFATAEFIAHARTDLPAALDEITRLRAALDEARAEVAKRRGEHDFGAFMSQAEWDDWSNSLARLVPEEYEDDIAQEAIIERALADLVRRVEAAESALASIRTLARSWSGRHDLLMTGDSAAHDIEAVLAAPTTERSEG